MDTSRCDKYDVERSEIVIIRVHIYLTYTNFLPYESILDPSMEIKFISVSLVGEGIVTYYEPKFVSVQYIRPDI